jgi:hypothetical protein
MLIALAVQHALPVALDHRLQACLNKLQLTEQRTGYHNFDTNTLGANNEAFDPAAETAKASGLAGSLVIDQNVWGGLQGLAHLALQGTEKSIQSLKDTDPPKRKSNLDYMKQVLVISSQKFAARRIETASLQARASIQIQGLFNIIAQREQELTRKLARDNIQLTQATLHLGEATRQIAEDSKRDSTSMKAIAAVTMFFLPGTFAASLFAMPIFRWNASSGNDVVSHRIWVYWAVTIPLTLVTFGCFLLWDHLMNKPRYPPMANSKEAAASNQSLATSTASADNSSADSVYGQGSGAVSRHSSAAMSRHTSDPKFLSQVSIASIQRSSEPLNGSRPTSTHTTPSVQGPSTRDMNSADMSETAGPS